MGLHVNGYMYSNSLMVTGQPILTMVRVSRLLEPMAPHEGSIPDLVSSTKLSL